MTLSRVLAALLWMSSLAACGHATADATRTEHVGAHRLAVDVYELSLIHI